MSDLNFLSKKHASSETITLDDYYFFYGNPYDERGQAAVDFYSKKAMAKGVIISDIAEQSIKCNGELLTRKLIEQEVGGHQNILIECTTLGLPEMLKLFKCLKALNVNNFKISYLEPDEYAPKRGFKERLLREFNLTKETDAKGVKGFAAVVEDGDKPSYVFFLGFEEGRLLKIIGQNEIVRDRIIPVIGVPAFKVGWDIDSTRNNVRALRQIGVTNECRYASSNDPLAAYDVLKKVFKQHDEEYPFIISPLGTKPHAIGTALFLNAQLGDYCNMGVLYDCPIPCSDQTSGVGKWHIYEVTW